MGVAYSAPLCPSAVLAATHSSSPEVGNGLSWPKPQCTCNAMVTSQAQPVADPGGHRGPWPPKRLTQVFYTLSIPIIDGLGYMMF